MLVLRTLALMLVLGAFSFAAVPATVNRSSNTATADSAYISGSVWLDSVIVSTTSAGTILTIYDSTFTTSNKIAVIDLGTLNVYDFKDLKVKGIFYVKTGTANVTILYKK